LSAILTGRSYAASALLAAEHGAFDGYGENRESMLRVIRNHRRAAYGVARTASEWETLEIRPVSIDHSLFKAGKVSLSNANDMLARSLACWDDALLFGTKFGFRNAQVTVIAPTGTIGLLMDCDTTGVEPDIALVKYKLLAGGGMLKIVNRTVPEALQRLGYSPSAISAIEKHIEIQDTIEDVISDDGAVIASGLKPEHLSVFDCAFKPFKGQRSIHYKAHLSMMGAAQPFVSGAISKTVNMPNDATTSEIRSAYVDAWKMGLKCVAIYRDGSKRSQPLNTKRTTEGGDKSDAAGRENASEQAKTLEARIAELETELGSLRESARHPIRRRLPDTRMAVNHKFDVAGHEGYLTVGLFDNAQPGELFVTMAKEGSTIGGLMDSVGALTSMSLQYGVPLEALVKKFAHQRFEPSGFTRNPDIRQASSIIDYVFRWMACQFIPGYREANSPNAGQAELPMPTVAAELKKKINRPVSDLALADEAEGSLMLKVSATTTTSEGIASAAAAGHMIAASLTATIQNQKDAPPCPKCGHIAVRNGACYKCLNCGESLGCS